MRKLIFTLLFILLPTVAGANSPGETSEGMVRVLPAVELALVIASLSELDRSSNGSIDRSSHYYQRIKAHFDPVRNHAVFEALGDSFSLPRLAGNAADFTILATGELSRVDTSGSLWRDEKNNLFLNYLPLIQDFADQGNFMQFFDENRLYYDQIKAVTRESIDERTMSAWLNEQYGESRHSFAVLVSPLLSRFHWTTLYKVEQRIWIDAPDAETFRHWSPIERMHYTRSVFTELDHAYVNPVTRTMLPEVNQAFGELDAWASGKAIAAYPSPELVFNEYMTWAVFLLYAQDQMQAPDFETLMAELVIKMESGRGFHCFGDFIEQALARSHQHAGNAVQLQKGMVEWALRKQPCSSAVTVISLPVKLSSVGLVATQRQISPE